jgi:hypothetical protein
VDKGGVSNGAGGSDYGAVQRGDAREDVCEEGHGAAEVGHALLAGEVDVMAA